jgi:transcriptional regulator with XRE-family HTH domain
MASAADLLVAARTASGLTQEQLAIRAGTKQSAISQIERGDVEPSFTRLRALIALTGHELDPSVKPRQLNIDEQLLMDSLAMLPEERISAAIRLSSFTGQLRREGEQAMDEQLERQRQELRELAGL